jgi:hypothetical protein
VAVVRVLFPLVVLSRTEFVPVLVELALFPLVVVGFRAEFVPVLVERTVLPDVVVGFSAEFVPVAVERTVLPDVVVGLAAEFVPVLVERTVLPDVVVPAAVVVASSSVASSSSSSSPPPPPGPLLLPLLVAIGASEPPSAFALETQYSGLASRNSAIRNSAPSLREREGLSVAAPSGSESCEYIHGPIVAGVACRVI